LVKILIIAGIVLLLLVVGYVGYILFAEWAKVKESPRVPMLLCDKHGPIMEQGTIEFFGTKYCGLCFHQRLSAAEHSAYKQ
jgi:hypothetical protein